MTETPPDDITAPRDDAWMNKTVAIREILWGLEDVPIMARLEFAKALVCGNGGEKLSSPSTPALVVAVELIESALVALRRNPKAANLKTPYEPTRDPA